MNLLSFIGQVFKPAADLVDSLHTSDEERLQMKAVMLEQQINMLTYALDYETKQLEAKSRIIEAEARSEHWITATWRPITMLSFVAAVLAYWFGLTPDEIPPKAIDNMFLLVQIGLGGYVVGRSAEKVIPGVVGALKKKDEI